MSIWLSTTKNRKSPWFTCVQVTCHISLESSQQKLQIFFRPHLNWKSVQKFMDLKSCKSPNFEIFENPNLGIQRQNDIWLQPLWSNTKNIIRGKVMVSPKFGPWWVLWIYVCMWFIHAPKVFQLCTNQLVIWFVQVHVNNWHACHSS